MRTRRSRVHHRPYHRGNLVDRVDQQLVQAGAELPPSDVTVGPGAPVMFVGPTSVYAWRIEQGAIQVLQQPNVTTGDAAGPKVTVARAMDAVRTGDAFTVSSSTGSGRYRVMALRARGAIDVVGLSLHDVDATMRKLRWVLLAAIAIVIGILGVVVFWVLRLGVRPLKRMTKTAGAIAAGDLSERVPAEADGTEARELGDALNAMLTTIEGAFAERAASEARLRRFVADASHELRTPVTTIRGCAELYRHGGLAEPAELDQAMRRRESESVRMASLVDDLLLLARLDEGRPLARESVDLGVLGVDAAADARAVAPDRVITAEVAEGVTAEGDEDRLRQVVGNLVANALVHTPAGTPVSLHVHNGGALAVVEVHDRGPGMTADVAERAFERFSRADASRSRHAGGSGLGLAIVRAIVVAHGGQVVLQSAPGAGTTVRVELPRAEVGVATQR
ncbi:MAG TPA: HAMP domain-containing sensor histidine kinase [Acidimicrobiia bacterium]|nr:HAMP domain-containing sensor histidine kinase [Acidimicrobiia bacterium]